MLKEAGIDPEIVIPEVDEHISTDLSPAQMVMSLALRKALSVERQLEERGAQVQNALLIAADTVVYDGRIIGKPHTEQEAYDTLMSLRGRVHQVYSGVCLFLPANRIRHVFSCRTDVEFTEYSAEDIHRYVQTGEPMDKAGSYAIQGGFAPYIKRICGSRDNVIGFPLQEIVEELSVRGICLNADGTGASETE